MGWREDARKEVKKIMAGGKFKLKEGENTFRVLPNRNGLDNAPYIIIMQHGDVGPDKRLVNCGKDTDGDGPCWLCDRVIPQLAKSQKKTLRDKAEAMRAKRQMIMQVATVNGGDWDGPFLWYVSTGGAKSLSTKMQNRLSSTRVFYDHPIKGRNLTINRVGTGMKDTSYGAPEPDEGRTTVPKEILRKLKRFEEIIPEYDPAIQKAMFEGKELPRRETKAAEEEAPKATRRRTKPKPEPEVEEEAEADFDFEAEAAPDAEAEPDAEADGGQEEFDFEEGDAETEPEVEEEADGDEFDFEGGDAEAEPEAEAKEGDDFDFEEAEAEPEVEGEAEVEAEAEGGDDLADFNFEDGAGEAEPEPPKKAAPKKTAAKKTAAKKTAAKKTAAPRKTVRRK